MVDEVLLGVFGLSVNSATNQRQQWLFYSSWPKD